MSGSDVPGGEKIDWVTFSVRRGSDGHHVRRDDQRDEYDGGLPQRWEYFRGDNSARAANVYASKKAAEMCAEGRLAAVIPLGARRSELELSTISDGRDLRSGEEHD